MITGKLWLGVMMLALSPTIKPMHLSGTFSQCVSGECDGYTICFKTMPTYGLRYWIMERWGFLLFPKRKVNKVVWTSPTMCAVFTDKFYQI